MLSTRERIVVGMSGGVDSSVAALLLAQAGHDVHGLFLQCWQDADGTCPASADATAAAAAAAAIGIELDVVDLIADYRRDVFEDFLSELRAGRTPNPDVWCNARIKFDAFMRIALDKYGADRIATGHYARIRDRAHLIKAEDENKDQTYFLYRLQRAAMQRTSFPLGSMLKREVRQKAAEAGLPTAARRESMGICFIGKRPFRDFISEHIAQRTGRLIDEHGRTLGSHQGAHLYTIGQRSGLGLGGPGDAWYVADKDVEANTVTAVRGLDHPLLFSSGAELIDTSWIAGKNPRANWVLTCRLRHRMELAPCTIESVQGDRATIGFAASQRAVAPGQALVLYDGAECIGGGTIAAGIGLQSSC